MKTVFSILALAVLSACAQTPTKTVEVAPPVQVAPQPPAHPYAMAPAPQRAIVKAPSWFVNLPEDTPEMTFAVGTATSNDEQMAYDKARMAAERKLVEQMSSRITTQTNNFRADRGNATVENFQQVTRKNARGELIGAQRVDSQVTHDGNFYKVYVLLRLPLGSANAMQTKRDQARLTREGDIRSRAAQRDMDQNEATEQKREQDAAQALERSLDPPAPAVKGSPIVGEIKLLDVDNEAYKKKRDEALAKPGAVIGQTTLR